jgi:hypothetical protein
MEKIDEARSFVVNSKLLVELRHRFEAHNYMLSIIQPFFSKGWKEMPAHLQDKEGISFASQAAVALRRIGALPDALEVSETALRIILARKYTGRLSSQLLNMGSTAGEMNKLYLEDRLINYAGKILSLRETRSGRISYLLSRFRQNSNLGRWADAQNDWLELQAIPDTTDLQNIAAHHYAVYKYLKGELSEEILAEAESLSRMVNSALSIRNLYTLRGSWLLDLEDYSGAKKVLQKAVRFARQSGKIDKRSEIRLAIARQKLGDLVNPEIEIKRLANSIEGFCHYDIACLYSNLEMYDLSKQHALAAYNWAWADGKPYYRYSDFEKARTLLMNLKVKAPELSSFKTSKHHVFEWERDLKEVIVKLQESFEQKSKEHANSAIETYTNQPGRKQKRKK